MTTHDLQLLTGKQLAELLAVHPAVIADWRHKNQGPPYIRISVRSIRYRLVDVEEWMDSRYPEDPTP